MAHSVLLIDDEPLFCSSLQQLLLADHYRVDVAPSGREALNLIRQETYSAALVDINLPDIGGLDIAARISETHPDTAILILTGIATLDSVMESLRLGVHDYLRKPCDPDLLLRTVARAIEHKRLQAELRISEKRFRQLAQATWEGIIIYDRGRLLQTNPQLCQMFGYEEEELLDRQIFDVLLDRASIRALPQPLDVEAIGPFEARGRRKNGVTFPVEIRVKNIDYQGRQVQVAAIRDVTAAENAMQQKMALAEKLADARRMESLGMMASSVAHDLNNILSGIITIPELLLMDLGREFKHRDELMMIREAGKRAAAVVGDLLTVARGATCAKEVQDLNQIVSSYLGSVECREISQRHPLVRMHHYLEDKLLPVRCSNLHLSKTIMNLVNNAAEAIQGEGQVIISTRNIYFSTPFEGYELIEPGEYVLLSVEDNGPGISPTDLKQIFSPFYSKKIMGRSGTGLGLAVVWNTVHDHCGFIDVATSGRGTVFSLYFPVDRSEISKPWTPQPVLSHFFGNGERILVVDDQKSQLEIARRLLSRLGYRPLTAGSGEEAIECIKRTPVDLVILDMIMDPGINGCETYRRIIKHTPRQKAIITSGYSNTENIQQAMALGISQYIRKPYSLQELAQALRVEIHSESRPS